jgi:hypothetical protein
LEDYPTNLGALAGPVSIQETLMKNPQARTHRPKTFLVYGLDVHNKPHAAQVMTTEADSLAERAAAMDFQICEASTKRLKEVATRLPSGDLRPQGDAVIPEIEEPLYRRLFDLLVAADYARAKNSPSAGAVTQSGLPETWDQIAPGHVVIAQESLAYGWCEALVLHRDSDTLQLRFRDYPSLPKFTRPIEAVALMTTAPAMPAAIKGKT